MTAKPRRVPMSNVDKAWLEMDSATNLMIINGVLLFEDTIDFEELKDILAERFVAKYERFRQRVVVGSGGRLYWEDDPHFDIRAHVRRYALPEPGDIATLQTVVSAIVNEPLDRRKPLWRYMLIENVEGGCAVLARLHHCIGDGIALIKVLLNMTGATPGESLQVLHLPPQQRPPVPNPLRSCAAWQVAPSRPVCVPRRGWPTRHFRRSRTRLTHSRCCVRPALSRPPALRFWPSC